MNIYISKQIKNLYFYGDSITLTFNSKITKHNLGLSYVLFCICKGTNDLDSIALKLIERFKIASSVSDVKKMILSYTVEDESIKDAFSFDIDEANLLPKANGIFGKRYPEIIHIELTGTCNYACSHCYKNASSKGEYIDFYQLKEKVYEKFKGIVPVVHFTGGEPTIHGNFREIIDMFSDCYVLQLTTNGSEITTYPIEVFRKFQTIDISLYGLSTEEYRVNTGNPDAYERVKAGCNMLCSANIDFRVTLVLNNENWHQMEEYVKYGVAVGAESIGLALPMQSVKLLNAPADKWTLTKETRREIYKEFRRIQDAYRNIIRIIDWYRSDYSDMWKSYPTDDSLRCGAGKNAWWMSEKYTFRPCSFLPDQYMNLDYDTWYRYITSEQELDWSKARSSLELFASEQNNDITDFCRIFRK